VSSLISRGFNSAIIQSVAAAVHIDPPDVYILALVYVGTKQGWAAVTYGIKSITIRPDALRAEITAPGTSDLIVTSMSNYGYYVTLSRPNVTDISPTTSPSSAPTPQPIPLPQGPLSGVIVGGLVFLLMITATVFLVYWKYYRNPSAPSGPEKEKDLDKDIDYVGIKGPMAMSQDI
jgi:hypothetical protein